MLASCLLLAAVISLHAATPAPPAGQTVYRIEMAGNQVVWASDPPKDTGSLVLFHRYPGGMLVSVKKSDVRRIVSAPRAQAPRGLWPGSGIDLGQTGSSAAPGTGNAPLAGASPAPGSRKDGTALLNPDRPYRPDWDSRQVPGANLAYPASPNDYREGRSMAYPPGSGVQSAPGEPPKMAPGSGEPPKAPSL